MGTPKKVPLILGNPPDGSVFCAVWPRKKINKNAFSGGGATLEECCDAAKRSSDGLESGGNSAYGAPI